MLAHTPPCFLFSGLLAYLTAILTALALGRLDGLHSNGEARQLQLAARILVIMKRALKCKGV